MKVRAGSGGSGGDSLLCLSQLQVVVGVLRTHCASPAVADFLDLGPQTIGWRSLPSLCLRSLVSLLSFIRTLLIGFRAP